MQKTCFLMTRLIEFVSFKEEETNIIKFPFKRKACQVYEGGCCRQVSTVVFLVVWWTGGCHCKVVAVDRKIQLCL